MLLIHLNLIFQLFWFLFQETRIRRSIDVLLLLHFYAVFCTFTVLYMYYSLLSTFNVLVKCIVLCTCNIVYYVPDILSSVLNSKMYTVQ